MKEFIIGLLVSKATAATGVGGSSFTVPLLILVCGASPANAVGTAFAYATLIRSLAAAEYARRGEVDWDAVRRMLLGAAPGVVAGTLLLSRLMSAGLVHMVGLLIGLTVSGVALFSLVRSRPPEAGRARERRNRLGWISAPIGLQVGFSSVGAGALGSLLLLTQTRLAAAAVVGTVLVFGLGLSLLGTVFHVAAGHCDFPLLARLSVGGMLGVLAGGWIANRVPSASMRSALLLLLALLGGRISWQGVQGMLALIR